VYPILADHNPHLKNIKAFDGDVTAPNKTFINPYDKTTANDWHEGNTFAFVIDYISQNKITLRLFIQSSSCNPTCVPTAPGKPAKCFSFLDSLPPHGIDIALIGIASYQSSPKYPAEQHSILQQWCGYTGKISLENTLAHPKLFAPPMCLHFLNLMPLEM
jgi:hypothetical protein